MRRLTIISVMIAFLLVSAGCRRRPLVEVDNNVFTASYSHTITNNRGQVTHECSLSGSATIGELKSYPTITMK